LVAALAIAVTLFVPVADAVPPPPPGAGENPPRTAPAEPGQVQGNPAPPASRLPVEPAVTTREQSASSAFITAREELLSLAILFFGLVVLLVQFLLLRSPRRNSYEILQLLAINLIVTGTLFLISAGYGAEQIAPGLGLFGTIAGYVLGRRAGEVGDESEARKGGNKGGTP
jgi:hypothetical protein